MAGYITFDIFGDWLRGGRTVVHRQGRGRLDANRRRVDPKIFDSYQFDSNSHS